uniref:SHSP domain-containing protein n=1 Tax=Acrobeloides nanus TaxID=290746 RepID=A0A914CZR2_9BILA
MALRLLDPFFADPFTPTYRWISPRRYYDPLREVSHMLNMADAMMHQMEQHLGELDVTEDGKFQYGCEIGGFRPEELKVDLEGDEVVVQGEHKFQDERQSIHRTFVRKFNLPEGVDKESIRCDLDNKGRLQIYGQKLALEDSQKKKIPIELKQNAKGNKTA